MDSEEFDLVKIFRILIRNTKKILLAVISVTIISFLISLLLPEKYRSTTTFNIINPLAIDPISQIREVKYENFFSTRDNVYRALSIGRSKDARRHLINKYNLTKYYNSNNKNKGDLSEIVSELKSNIELETVKNSNLIKLSVYHKDSLLAVELANELTGFINKQLAKDISEKNQKVLNSLKKQIDSKQKRINKLKDSLQALRSKYNIMNSEEDGKLLAEELVKIQSKLNQVSSKLDYYKKHGVSGNKLSELRAQKNSLMASFNSLKFGNQKSAISLENFTKGADKIKALNQELTGAIKNLSEARNEYSKLRSSLNQDFQVVLVAEKGGSSSNIAINYRLLIVFLSALITFIIACIVVIFNTINNINKD